MKEDAGVKVEDKTWLMATWQLSTVAGESKGQGRLPPRAGKDLIPRE